MRFLSVAEYDDVLRNALREQGLSTTDSEALIRCRWPMHACSLPAEAVGRGIIIDHADWHAYLAEHAPEAAQDGDFDALLNAEAAEQYFRWCVSTGRARLTEVGRHLQRSDADRQILGMCRRASASLN